MCRTFGDVDAKVERFGGRSGVVVAVPEIKRFEVTEDTDFLLLGCDGIFDRLSSREAVDAVWKAARQGASVPGRSIHAICGECAEAVIRLAMDRETLDNVTVVIVAFAGFERAISPGEESAVFCRNGSVPLMATVPAPVRVPMTPRSFPMGSLATRSELKTQQKAQTKYVLRMPNNRQVNVSLAKDLIGPRPELGNGRYNAAAGIRALLEMHGQGQAAHKKKE